VLIRNAEPSDYPRVISVIDEWWGGRRWRRCCRSCSSSTSATRRSSPRTTAARGLPLRLPSQTHDDEAYIHFVGVDPAHRGGGLARTLYERFFAAVAPRTTVRAVTSPRNEGSLAFHRALGFEVERIDEDYDGRGESRAFCFLQVALRSGPSTPSGGAGNDGGCSVGVPVYRGSFGQQRPSGCSGAPVLGRGAARHRRWRSSACKARAQARVPGQREADRAAAARRQGPPARSRRRVGHDHCWWLDRMVRTSRPLTERMTLIWHDWFATSNDGVGSQRLMLKQNEMFRSHALGSFRTLLLDVTKDPAMLLWLNGTQNVKGLPNENYAREMMELFTLGADRGAYTEDDVREQARALTGWQNKWKPGVGDYDFHFERSRHDPGSKTIFRHRGTSTGRTRATSASSIRSTRRSSCRSCGATSCRSLPTMRPRRRSRRSTATATRCARSSRRSSSIPRSTTGRAW
jgi:Uncharacterized protein conserved in bacteria